ncbi:hypothetical protein GJ496_004739 [Pomphorhynchus laevis]|nr:hypothetical protein GJ496_004739 [Pomphorhynchus laevis]
MIQAYEGQVNLFILFEMFACTKELTVSSVITEELIISINEDNDDQNILPVCDNGGITKLVASHSYLTSMFAIYKNRIQTLRHLDLSHNLISNIDSRVISNLPMLAYLDLQYNRIRSIDHDCQKMLYRIDQCKMRFNYFPVTNINELSNVNWYESSTDLSLSGVTNGVFQKYRGMYNNKTQIIVTDSVIYKIDELDFTSDQLQKVNLLNNHLPQESNIIFSGNVVDIHISNCHLHRLTLFFKTTSSVQLQALDLSSNNLVEWNTDRILHSLITLNLDDNRLESFNSNMTPNIKLLSLRKNPIRQIEGTFDLLESFLLPILTIPIPKLLYTELRYLQTLKLHNCMISSITNGMLSDSTQLKEIDLSNNILNDMNSFLQYRYNLKLLNVSRNAITSIDLQTCPIIENIDVSYNIITSIMLPDTEYVYIKHLNLSFNELQSTDFLNFKKLQRLETLDLSHNRISSLDTSDLNFAKLNRLDMSFNILRNLDLTDDLISKLTEDSLVANNLHAVTIYLGAVDNNLPLTFLKEFFTADNKRSIVVSGQDKCAIAEHLCNFICQWKVMERYWFNDQPSSCNQC